MKLPEKITGRNRIRDAAIVLSWKEGELSTKQLSEKFKLTERRIDQILRTNHAFVPVDKVWEKKKRIIRLKRYLDKCTESRKDPVDILEQIRKELEGENVLLSGDALKPVINIIHYGEAAPRDNNSSSRIPAESVCVRDFKESGPVQEHRLAPPSQENNSSA